MSKTDTNHGLPETEQTGDDPSRRLPLSSWLLIGTAMVLLLPIALRVPVLLAPMTAQVDVLQAEPVSMRDDGQAGPQATDLIEAFAAVEPGAGATAEAPGLHGGAAFEALAAEVGRYRAKLEQREQEIVLREAAVKLVEERIREQVGELERLKGRLEQLIGRTTADEEARLAQLIKVYEAMKAKNAAAIFEPMELELLLPIVRGMRDTKVAAIVAEMDPKKARALTAELARTKEPLPGLNTQ